MAAVLDQPARPAGAARPRIDGAAVHSSPAARSSASVVLPTPSGPTSRTAWGTAPRIIVATAASAAACPRVRAPSMTLSVRRARLAPWSCASCAASVRRSVGVAASRSSAAGVAFAAAGLRVARGLAGAFAAGSAATASVDPADAGIVRAGAPSAAADADAAVFGRARLGGRLGRAPRSPRTPRPCAAARGLGRGRLAPVSTGDGLGRHARGRRPERPRPRPADRRLLGDLGSQHRLELGRHVAPRLVRAAAGGCRARADRRRGCSCGRRARAPPGGSGHSRRGSG